jgi:hypothetical protein
MRWYYQDEKAFEITESGDKYVTKTKPEICVVYRDSNKQSEPKTGSTYTRQELRDLHVIFGNNLENVPSNWTPHKESKNLAKINEIQLDKYHEEGDTVHLNVSQTVKKLPVGDAGFGAFNLTLTRRPCDRSGYTSGFASWYCEAYEDFLAFDCNFWFAVSGNFVVPTPKIEVTYEGIPQTSRTTAQSKDPLKSSSSGQVQQITHIVPIDRGYNPPDFSRHVLHMPAASVLESELEPKKRRKATRIFDSAKDAPGPSKAFKLCEDSTDGPGPSKAFKLCEDSVTPNPTKRLKLVSTDDSGRTSV